MAQDPDEQKVGKVAPTTNNDPDLPPPKLMAFTYASVSAASIVFILVSLIHLFSCGCKC